ncbi:PQQ-dependent sugar dehydrogenase [Pedobacter sp. PWIIR3]
MKFKASFLVFACFICIASSFVFKKADFTTLQSQGFEIDTLADNLRVPWQIAFLPDKSMIFTEREGRVRLYRNGKLVPKPAFTANDVVLRNKTGVLGLAVHPNFSINRYVYLASNYQLGDRMKLRVVRFALKNDTLVEPLVILKDIPANQNHTGCRLVFAPDGKLYITTGDADQPMLAQDLKTYNGKILRFNDDGSIPSDNPFFKNDSARKEIWSYGHRNPQGLVFQKNTGLLFETEHGPTGGDEVNIITKGKNYGWPVIHHDDAKSGMEGPLAQYTPSIGPGEAMFYEGDKIPQLKGKLLVACLRGESILAITLQGTKITDQQVLMKQQYGRIRSLVTGPDGYIYFSTSMHDPGEGHPRDEHDDMILRLRPSGSVPMVAKQLQKTQTIAGKKQTPALLFQQLCASCHGDKLQGTDRGKSLLRGTFKYGASKQAIVKNITNGIVEKGMPAWTGAISNADINKLADYIFSYSK